MRLKEFGVMRENFINAIADLKEEKSLMLARKKIEEGETPLKIVEQCQRGVEIVGKRYSEGSYFLSDLIMSEEILREVIEILTPHFPGGENIKKDAKIIMGTVEGDIHDLGKNIVIYLLQSAGINVYDLGVDVEPEEFLKALKETGASILGISVLVTYSINAVKKVVDLIKEAGLREEVTIIIGGYPVNEHIKDYTGADYFQTNANKSVELIKDII